MTGRDIGLRGGKELLEFLDAFPAKLQKGAVRAGLVAAAKPIRDQARQNVAKRRGKVAKTIKTASPQVKEDGTVRIKIRLKGYDSYIGYFLEYGVRPHLIMPKANRPMRADGKPMSTRSINKAHREGRAEMNNGVLVINGHFVAGAVMHPGFVARPFLRPALDQRSEDAIKAFGDRIRSYLQSKASFTAPVTVEVDD